MLPFFQKVYPVYPVQYTSCVHATKDAFDVATLKDVTFWCCTCQKGSCSHSQFLSMQVMTKDDMPSDLQEIVCIHLQRKGHVKSAIIINHVLPQQRR